MGSRRGVGIGAGRHDRCMYTHVKTCSTCKVAKPNESYRFKRPATLDSMCIDCHRIAGREWAQRNKARYAYCNWSNDKKRKHAANVARRRATQLGAAPQWVDWIAIESIYRNKPEGLHVDHIVPLNGKTVCGLHVPWNLEYLTPEANAAKSNRLAPVVFVFCR